MDEDFMNRLDTARDLAGIAFKITSGYRCKEYDDRIHGDGNHPQGKAADIEAPNSVTRWKIIDALIRCGFRRIGIDQQFIHADTCTDRPQQVMWLY
jgi:uncharacterized protein YcbK (DUF882 family)